MFRGRCKSGVLLAVAGVFILTGLTSCMDQYNPRRYWAQYKQERETAHRVMPKLTDKGELPAPVEAAPAAGTEVASGPINPGKAKYDMLCVACHGADGKADGAAAAALNPRPRNFHDKAWHAKVDDAHIKKVIKEGGASVGLSATMAPWGSMLNDEELNGMVSLIREWGK